MPVITPERAGGKNRCAFLDMLAVSELGPLLGVSDNGYNVIVGSIYSKSGNHKLDLFTDYRNHPRKLVDLPKLGIKSTAAGRYQILARFYDVYKVQLKLPDFSPLSQDLIALQLMRECRAFEPLDRGDIKTAITRCKSRWASLPGAGYNQNEHSMDYLVRAYTAAGGTVS